MSARIFMWKFYDIVQFWKLTTLKSICFGICYFVSLSNLNLVEIFHCEWEKCLFFIFTFFSHSFEFSYLFYSFANDKHCFFLQNFAEQKSEWYSPTIKVNHWLKFVWCQSHRMCRHFGASNFYHMLHKES